MFGRISNRKMDSSDVKAVFYICPIENLESILSEGIHNHKEVRKRHPSEFKDLSNSDVQDIRSNVWVTEEATLHDYVNFYINPHNAMLYNLRKSEVCILRISSKVLDEVGTKLSKKNASLSGAEFSSPREWTLSPTSSALATSPRSYVGFEESWLKRKNVRQAEVLIPVSTVSPDMIEKIYVESDERNASVEATIRKLELRTPTKVKPSLFSDHTRTYSPLDRLSPVTDPGSASPRLSLPIFSGTLPTEAERTTSLDDSADSSTESDSSVGTHSEEELSDSDITLPDKPKNSAALKRRKVVVLTDPTLS